MKFIYKASKERQFKERYLHVERMKLSFSKFYSCRENIFHLMLRQKSIAKLQSNLLCRGAWTTLTLISPMCIFPVMFLSQPLIYMGLYSKTSLLRWKWKETSLCLYRWEMLMRWDSSPSLSFFFLSHSLVGVSRNGCTTTATVMTHETGSSKNSWWPIHPSDPSKIQAEAWECPLLLGVTGSIQCPPNHFTLSPSRIARIGCNHNLTQF